MSSLRGAGPAVVLSVAVGLAGAIVAGRLGILLHLSGGMLAETARATTIALVTALVCLRLLSAKTPDGRRVPSFDPRLDRCILFGVLGGVLASGVASTASPLLGAGVSIEPRSLAVSVALALALGAIVGCLCGLALRPLTMLAFGRLARRSGDAFDGALLVSSCLAATVGHLGGLLGALTVGLGAIGLAICAVSDLRRASWIESVADGKDPQWSITPNDDALTLGSHVDGVEGDAILMRAPPAQAAGPFRSAERPSPVALVDRTGRRSSRRARVRAMATIAASIVLVIGVPLTIQLAAFMATRAQALVRNGNRALPGSVDGIDGDLDKLAVGQNVACARKTDGSLWCWGGWPAEALGLSTTARQQKALGTVSTFTVGDRRICAVPDRGDHRAVCWGTNSMGELGDGKPVPYRGPQPVGPPDVVELATGATFSSFTVARTKDGRVWQWGYDAYEDREYPGATREPHVIAGISAAVQLAAGRNHACALDDSGAVFCWGNAFSGQTGLRLESHGQAIRAYMQPARVEGLPPIDLIVVGGETSAAHRRRSDGKHEWWSWGARDPWGRDREISHRPDRWGEVAIVPGTDEMRALTLGFDTACGLFEGGSVRCWGNGQQGRLGDGKTELGEHPMSTPVTVGALEVSGEEEVFCARRTRDVVCWGHL